MPVPSRAPVARARAINETRWPVVALSVPQT